LNKAGKSVFGYKQHTVVDGNGLVLAVKHPANRHDSQPFVDLVDKEGIEPGNRVHADKNFRLRPFSLYRPKLDKGQSPFSIRLSNNAHFS